MARARSPAREKAREIYLKAKGNIKLLDIAKELGVLDTQIRKWKSQDKWEQELKGTLPIEKENKKKGNVTKKKKVTISDEVKEVLDNTELNDKQKLFCVIYAKCLNATKAYLKAYTCTYETAMVNGNKALRNTKIKEQIDLLISKEFNKEFIKRSLLQKYIDIAFSDIGEYITFGKKTKRVWARDDKGNNIPVIDPETLEQKEVEFNYIDLKESSMIDTTLISEVSEGKDGVKFKLLDKMKAMDFLTKHVNLLNDEEKTKLDLEYKKLQNEKTEMEIAKLKQIINSDDEEEVEDDGFIAALGNKVTEVWANEEDS
ncbi:terminase small subunit [Clostridium gasigenes]|uniref:Phage terminase small subunit n=1 Tax=Clostridium gasigenes TaxID=94869 RepID=A0A1H0N547_9CLOT|nr:terminase small subunit [Clostridium gasigenes]SDO87751.1 phage terminase small subunit [Clostridium gasigenes]